MEEAKAIKAQLARRGIQAFLCDVPPGEDIAAAVIQALHHCKLAIILGTATYGKKTASPCSTYQELRYIDQHKPYFLVKMCHAFQEPEAIFRLPQDISFYPWQPIGDERKRVPVALVEQILQRLESVEATVDGRSSQASSAEQSASHASHTSSLSPPHALHGISPAAASGASSSDLADWLASLSLSELQPALQAAGIRTLQHVQFAMSQGLLGADDFVAHGHAKIPVALFLHEAAKVKGGGVLRQTEDEISPGGPTVALGVVDGRLQVDRSQKKSVNFKARRLIAPNVSRT